MSGATISANARGDGTTFARYDVGLDTRRSIWHLLCGASTSGVRLSPASAGLRDSLRSFSAPAFQRGDRTLRPGFAGLPGMASGYGPPSLNTASRCVALGFPPQGGAAGRR